MFTQWHCKVFCTPSAPSLTGGGFTITFGKDSVQVGDTFWITSSIPKILAKIDASNNETVDMSGASDVSTDFHIIEIKANKWVGRIDSFEFLEKKGRIVNNTLALNTAKSANYVEENNFYQQSFGLIAQKKSIYAFTLIDIFQARKQCIKASIEVLLENADSHIYYLNRLYYPNTALAIEITHTYSFIQLN